MKIKTPLAYYGGKQYMLRHILHLIPHHRIYIEPFCGGGSVYWAKDKADIEVINDTNEWVITFFKVLKDQVGFLELKKKLDATLHSRALHAKAKKILLGAGERDDISIAWALCVQTQMSFAKGIFKGWGYSKKGGGGETSTIRNKIDAFSKIYCERLRETYIENNDALKVINTWDDAESFLYCDPPYFDSHKGHYKNYTEEDFVKLLDKLCVIKGKFLLSSYFCEVLTGYVKRENWIMCDFKKIVSVNVKRKSPKFKTECLIRNY